MHYDGEALPSFIVVAQGLLVKMVATPNVRKTYAKICYPQQNFVYVAWVAVFSGLIMFTSIIKIVQSTF